MLRGVARGVRARGTRLLSTRTTTASVGIIAHALGLAVGFVAYVLMRLLMRVHVDGVDGVDGGVCGGRSGRLAAGPSPPVPGPSACSRAPAAAAIWRRAVASHATVG